MGLPLNILAKKTNRQGTVEENFERKIETFRNVEIYLVFLY